jgi:hypothetical protein
MKSILMKTQGCHAPPAVCVDLAKCEAVVEFC